MARGKLWSVKGVSPEAREAAKAAAQNSDLPIGVWIDQAILMSGDDESKDETNTAAPPDEVSELDIVTILQALEVRVGDHADRITEQLGPVRDSISELGARLERLEHNQRNAPSEPNSETQSDASPAEAEEPVQDPAPEHGPVDEPDTAEAAHHPIDPKPEDVPDDASEARSRAAEAGAKIDPGNITEADIHAADAALKSELTGLFDDGTHRQNAALHTPSRDPFMPRRPPRRSSKAPLVFVLAILLAAVAGVAAVAWFEFLSPEMRKSLTTGVESAVDSAKSQTPAQPTRPEATSSPEAQLAAPAPVDAQPAAPKPPTPASAPSVVPTPPIPAPPRPLRR